jgi:SAM-dependent methyltransferase
VRVLDIGCGQGIGQRLDFEQAVRANVDELWGIEPDEAERPAPGRFDHHQHALMETAQLPADYFDIAFSCMVMEHVEDPLRFMRALARCLKPGGVYLFVTPNIRHYFTRTAALLHALHLDEMVLRFINRQGYEDYHYPVRYRFNSERRIGAVAAQAGWSPPEYAYIEADDPVGYMRGPLRPILHLLSLKRRLIRNPRSLVTLVGRLTRPGPR